MDTGVGSNALGTSEWHTVDIEVRIKDSHQDPALAGQQGVIRGISVKKTFFGETFCFVFTQRIIIFCTFSRVECAPFFCRLKIAS